MSRFSSFAMLYMAALFLELAEQWDYPGFTIGILALAVLLIRWGVTSAGFFLFLAATTAHFVLIQFPDVANHVNLAIWCNVVLMVGIGYAAARKQQFPADDEVFELIRPLLMLGLVLVYVLAGFHKLNADFFNPEVSCATDMIRRVATLPRATLFGIPMPGLLAALILPAGYLLLRSRWRSRLPIVAVLVGIAVLVGAAVVLLVPTLRLSTPGLRSALLIMAGVIVLWELVGGLLLTVPRAQAAVLAFSWAMHATLALVNFVDFSALALALMLAFVPGPWFVLLNAPVRLPGTGRSIGRIHLYCAINVLTGVAGLHSFRATGLVFSVAALVLVWPFLRAAVGADPRPAWVGVPLRSPLTPRWMMVFPVLLILFGLTPYLGLRTAGNFSMFSNLRTEGPRSNHLLLGGNPLKRWGYQEDVVEITRIRDLRTPDRFQDDPMRGNLLTVVELRRMIHDWTAAGIAVPMNLMYRGKVHSTPDITQDPVWRVGERDWAMRLLLFRVIQPDGPNQCRW
jgi:hypothetical protein